MDKALNCVSGKAANDYVAALKEGGKMVDLPGAASVRRPGVEIMSDYVVRGDGVRAGVGDVVLEVAGPAGAILTAERTALNFLQRLSGVATLANRFATRSAIAWSPSPPGVRAGAVRTYRVARVRRVTVTGEPAARPPGRDRRASGGAGAGRG